MLGFLICSLVTDITDSPAPGYFRQPAVHGETVVFTAEGDLWKVPIAGGSAVRLTSHQGPETRPAISPNGEFVAFSARYEGPTEVYFMPLSGGLPTRLTWEGDEAIVVGWKDDNHVAYATQRYATLPNFQMATIHRETRDQNLVPLSQAAHGTWSEDSRTLYFTRFHKQGSSTKRYKGGTAENIWKYTDGDDEAIPLTSDYAGTSRQPMVRGDRVYFTSDRDGTMNVWSMSLDGTDLKQHTQHSGFDVLGTSLHGNHIVYQLAADLWHLDLDSGETLKIDIRLPSDFDQRRETWIRSPMSYVSSVDISPDGDRVVATSRGRTFVLPVKQGRRIQLTRESGVRIRSAQFDPDGKHLLLQSDESGEFEFWKLPANGIGDAEQLSTGGNILRFRHRQSPDGKFAAWYDKNNELWLLDIEAKTTKRIAASEYFNFSDLAWSPDSRWLAFASNDANHMSRIRVYDCESEAIHTITTDRADSYSPAWSPDGKWMYFLSDRNLYSLVRSPWGARQPEPYFAETTKIYELALQPDLRSPFAPEDEFHQEENSSENGDADKPEPDEPTDDSEPTTDEANTETQSSDSKDEPKNNDETADKKSDKVTVEIDFDGIIERLREVPVGPGRYANLKCSGKQLYWTSRENSKDATRRLRALSIKHDPGNPVTLASKIKSYRLSGNRKKLLIHIDSDLFVCDATDKAPELGKCKVDLSGWSFALNPPDEWRQMLVDAWRMERDYFYDRNLHGIDWQEVLDRHLPLVDRVTNRAELSDLIAQMVGELEALHIYVRGGDHRSGSDQVKMGSLGAILGRDEAAGGYSVTHIYRSDPDYPSKLSPLTQAQPPIRTGDVLLAINGVPLLSANHPNELLRNEVERQVALTYRDSKTNEERNTIVKPISQSRDADLRYSEWEYTRRLAVDEASDGDIGYVHLRAMGGDNFSEWAREFYPVFNRSGLIVDVRNNRGGNIDSWILAKLMRQAWFYWKPRVGQPYWNMQYAFRGHMVVLCNERTASDGEAFCEGFRRLGMGKVIGTRTWGGEIWLSYDNPLVDKGYASAAQTGVYGPEGKWLIEGHGVDPDIVIDNLPHATFEGKDAQLERAIAHLKERIVEEPVTVPEPPPYPIKQRIESDQ